MIFEHKKSPFHESVVLKTRTVLGESILSRFPLLEDKWTILSEENKTILFSAVYFLNKLEKE